MKLQKRNMYAVHRNCSTTDLKLLLKNRKGNALDHYALKKKKINRKTKLHSTCNVSIVRKQKAPSPSNYL